MNNIPPINHATQTQGIWAVHETRIPDVTNQAALTDRVEISELAWAISRSGLDVTEIRADKVMAVREAIANGTYETQDKIEFTVNRLMEVLRY